MDGPEIDDGAPAGLDGLRDGGVGKVVRAANIFSGAWSCGGSERRLTGLVRELAPDDAIEVRMFCPRIATRLKKATLTARH
jgi:hypothetical protein